SINKCPFCGKNYSAKLPINLQQLRSSRIKDQFEICCLHFAETSIIPDGLNKNYPKVIDFVQLPERVNKLYSELWTIGKFELFQPGYYGFKGSYTILNTLVTLFIDSKKLSLNMTLPLKPLEYLGEVLVPETGIRLIAQDRNITLVEVAEVMRDSIAFGMYVCDMEDNDISNLED
ncbi:9555_t:CDS:2, partial [Gigaspora margarita]